MNKRECRTISAELRAAATDKGRTLSGYAAQYGVLSTCLFDPQFGEYYEIIEPGAFAEAVNDDVTCNIDHDDHDLLGRTPNTLTLTDDATGLHFECLLPDTAAGQKAIVHVERGDISKCSFAFDVLDETWDTTEDGLPLRKLVKCKLYDVAAVIRPAYEFDTGLSVRSLEAAQRRHPGANLVLPGSLLDPHAARRKILDLAAKF